ncbi:MAG TPA: PQQ-binding-like beta-propeller repeat protein, partial [Acidimicrobiales bacterium]
MAQPDDRVSELGALLLTDDDFDGNDAVSLSGVGDPPFTPEDDDYYEGPPGLLCPDHEAPALVGTGDVFSLLVREDEVFVGEWIAGEPAADANSRYREGIAAFEACDEPFENDDGDQVTLQDRPLAHQALDDLARYVYDVAGEPVTDVVYARNGGLLMLIYLTGGLRAGEADEILRVALDKLAAADRTEWPAAPEPVDPSIDMDEPGEFAEVQYDGVTCSAVAEVPLGLQAATEVDLPREQAAALRWHVTAEAEGARSNAVAPNDAADAGVAYGVDGSLHFVDLDNRLKWVWPADETGDVDITDRVYALARDESDYAVVALDVDTGEPDWAMRWAEPDDVPREVAAVDTKVYAMGAVGVTAHDAATGAALWRAEGDLLGADGNVALVDTRAGQGCGLVAIDAATGGVKWAGLPAPSPSAYLDIAAIPAGAVVFVASRPHATGAEAVQGADRVTVQAFDVSSGRILWAQA